MSTKQTPHGMIIGAGIGGLAIANALNQRGISCQVFEAAPQLTAVGAGLWVAPNGLNVLQRIHPQLQQAALDKGFGLREIEILNHKGKSLSTLNCAEIQAQYGNAPVCIRRSDLQEILLRALKPHQVQVGKQGLSLQEDGAGISVHFADGSSARGDFLIGADGIHSQIREALFGKSELRYSGQTCWRALCPLSLPAPWSPNAAELWGDAPGLRAGFSQVSVTEAYYYLTEAQAAGGQDNLKRLKHDLLQKFNAFPDVVLALIKATPPEAFIRGDLYDFAPIPQYHKGRAVLIGDAAHATTPNLGQGANQALESALALALSLEARFAALGVSPSHSDISAALTQAYTQYQRIRQPKASWIAKQSFQIAKLTNLKSAWQQHLRNFVLSHIPASLSAKQFDRIYRLDF